MPAPVLIALGFVAAGGVAAGTKGVSDLMSARASMKQSAARHRAAVNQFEAAREECMKHLEDYGHYQLTVQVETLGAFVDWLESNERKVRRLDRVVLDGVEVIVPSLPTMKTQVLEAKGLLRSSISSIAAGTAARSAALAGVNAFASASTGTAISALSGAAAQNAALAYLGGGSLASGGGGMAAGATVLSGVAIAPAVLITGISLGIQGSKAKTRAAKMQAQVDESIANMKSAESVLVEIESRADELRAVLERLAARSQERLRLLGAVDFDPEVHAGLFFEAAQLIRSISDVLNTPLLDEQGNLTTESISVTERYMNV